MLASTAHRAAPRPLQSDATDTHLQPAASRAAATLAAFAVTRTDLDVDVAGVSWGYNWGGGWGWQADEGNSLNTTGTNSTPLVRLAMLTQCQREPMAALFEGINAIDGSSVKVYIPKLKLHLANNRRLITDDMAELSLTGTVLHAGLSPTQIAGYYQQIIWFCTGTITKFIFTYFTISRYT